MPVRTAVVVLFVLAAAGCTSNLPRYPSSWAPIADSCEPPQGTFRNRGELATPLFNPTVDDDLLLAYLMDPYSCEARCGVDGVDRVSLEPESDGQVLVRAWRGPDPHLQRVITGHCTDGRWEMTGGWKPVTGVDAGNAVMAGVVTAGLVSGDFVVNQRRSFAQARDGSLVIHDREQGVGLFLLVLPRYGDSARWVRFLGAEPAAADPEGR